jgi:hypothetical protein
MSERRTLAVGNITPRKSGRGRLAHFEHRDVAVLVIERSRRESKPCERGATGFSVRAGDVIEVDAREGFTDLLP